MEPFGLLTNDAKFLVSSMYKEYILRRKQGKSKDESVTFGEIQNINEDLMKEWSFEDTLFTCRELKRQNFITGTNYGDDNMVLVRLSTEAIAIMESKFKDDAKKVLDFAIKIKSLIPFV